MRIFYVILLATTVLASTLEIHDPRKDPRKCGRSNFNSASYICDSQKVLSSEAQERIDLIARTIGHAGPKVVVVVLKSVQKAKGAADDSEETYTHAQSHEAACNIAERARSVWDLDIVLVLLSEEKQFCSSSVAPPTGMSKSQMEYIQTVAENAMEMGLTENALTFSLLRIHSLLAKSNSKAMAIRRPSQPELKQVFISALLPFIGFGFLDNGLMILYGELIEDVIGRFFPISTLAAAAIGNLVSDIVGTYAAGGVKYLADLAGATEPDLASAQKALPVVRQTRLLGEMIGITTGCLIGMTPLLFRGSGAATDADDGVGMLRRSTSTLDNIKC